MGSLRFKKIAANGGLVLLSLLVSPAFGSGQKTEENPFDSERCLQDLVGRVEIASYSGLTFELTRLGGRGFSLRPRKMIVPPDALKSPIMRSIGRIWDPSEFLIPRAPLHIGTVTNKAQFDLSGVPRVLDMPIKFPNSRGIYIPAELNQFREAIQKIMDFEFSVNPQFNAFYAYLTVDQKYVESGSSHRNSGPHVDGLQGRNYPVKLSIDHSYLVSNLDPTWFFTNSFNLSRFDVTVDDFNKIFAQQADYSTLVRPGPYEIVMMDAFTVHESPVLSQGGLRTLLRLEFSEKVFDRLGNTHNPLFNYQWNMVPRPIPNDLR